MKIGDTFVCLDASFTTIFVILLFQDLTDWVGGENKTKFTNFHFFFTFRKFAIGGSVNEKRLWANTMSKGSIQRIAGPDSGQAKGSLMVRKTEQNNYMEGSGSATIK